MVEALLTVPGTIRAALSTRRGLILKTVVLRYQLGVLARSDRRVRLFALAELATVVTPVANGPSYSMSLLLFPFASRKLLRMLAP
jgi:hypothetical protein